MNWRTESNHELPIRQACNSRPWNEAIGMQLGGVGGGCWNIYLHLSIFLPTRGIFFLSRPLGSARYFDRVLCSFYQNYLVHWFIPFSLPLSLSLFLSLFLSLIRVWWHALWSTSKSPRVNFNAVSAVTCSTENRRWTDQIYYFRGKSGTGGCFKAGSESRLWLFARRLFLPLYETVIRLFSRVRLKFETYLCIYIYIYINLKLFEIHRWLDGYYIGIIIIYIVRESFKMERHKNVGIAEVVSKSYY